MKKISIFSLIFGLAIFQGCSNSTSRQPPTQVSCTTNADCAATPAAPLCNTANNKCMAETATACLPVGGSYCPGLTPAQRCNSTGTGCIPWPRLSFLTAGAYTIGTAYNPAVELPSSDFFGTISSATDADRACQDEYVAQSASANYPAGKTFRAILATPTQSMWSKINQHITAPGRPIYDFSLYLENQTPTSGLLGWPITDVLTANTVCSATSTFECANYLISPFKLNRISMKAIPDGGFLWTGAPKFTTGFDTTSFFTSGTAATTCSNWGTKTGTGNFGSASGANWAGYDNNPMKCDFIAMLLCIETDS